MIQFIAMRILQLINALTWGGAQVLVLDLCRFLSEKGNQVAVAAFRDGPVGQTLRDEGFRVEILPEKFFDLVGFAGLKNFMSSFSPEIIHTHLFRATLWGRIARMAKPGTPLFTSIHGIESPGYCRLEKKMAHFSDLVIFPSRYIRDWYRSSIRQIPEHREKLIYPGAPVFEEPKLKFVSPKIRIGTLSRLHPVKGLDTFIEACEKLKKKGFQIEAIIGGEGKDRQRLERMVLEKDLGEIVQFQGSIYSVKSFLDRLDIFVSPSREEAFGISLCEAMERGLPVVAGNVGGIPELIENQTNGILFTPGDAKGLEESLTDLIKQPAKRTLIGQKARGKILSSFPRERWLQANLDIYRIGYNKKHKNVHVAISSNELGGGERMALAFAASLRQRKWEVKATCAGEPLAGEFRRIDVPVDVVPMKAGGIFWASRLGARLRKTRPSVIHTHLNKASLIGAFLRKVLDIPLAGHVHGLNRASYYRGCDRLIAVSKAVRENLISQGIDPAQISTLPNCIDKTSVSFKRKPGPPWIIAIPAKLHKNKGHAWALSAIEKAMGTLPEFKIWIFGDGPERGELIGRFQKGPLAGRIEFRGFKTDMDQFYPSVHLVLLPSLGEGIPLSLLEAMCWGIPVIATRVGGIPEIIEDGINGILVEPGNGHELVNALQRVFQPRLWEDFSKNASRLFPLKNSYSEMISGLEKILLELQTPS